MKRSSRTAALLVPFLLCLEAASCLQAKADVIRARLHPQELAIPREMFLPRFDQILQGQSSIERRSVHLGFELPTRTALQKNYDGQLGSKNGYALAGGAFPVEIVLTATPRPRRDSSARDVERLVKRSTPFQPFDNSLAGQFRTAETIFTNASGQEVTARYYKSIEQPAISFRCSDNRDWGEPACVGAKWVDDKLRVEVLFLEKNLAKWKDIWPAAEDLIAQWRK